MIVNIVSICKYSLGPVTGRHGLTLSSCGLAMTLLLLVHFQLGLNAGVNGKVRKEHPFNHSLYTYFFSRLCYSFIINSFRVAPA